MQFYKHQKVETFASNLKLQTIQILKNDVLMLILCLSYFITTVPPIIRSLGISLGKHIYFSNKKNMEYKEKTTKS